MTTTISGLQSELAMKWRDIDFKAVLSKMISLWPLFLFVSFLIFMYYYADQVFVWIYLLSGPLSKIIP